MSSDIMWHHPSEIVYIVAELIFSHIRLMLSLRLRLRQNGHHFADDSFKCIFFDEDLRISSTILLKFVPDGSINKKPPSMQIMAYFTDQCVPLHIHASPGLDELSDFHLNCDVVSIDWWVQETPFRESIEGDCIMPLNNVIVVGLFCPYTDRYSALWALTHWGRQITNANWFPSTKILYCDDNFHIWGVFLRSQITINQY